MRLGLREIFPIGILNITIKFFRNNHTHTHTHGSLCKYRKW
jgi:hypothetical protein